MARDALHASHVAMQGLRSPLILLSLPARASWVKGAEREGGMLHCQETLKNESRRRDFFPFPSCALTYRLCSLVV